MTDVMRCVLVLLSSALRVDDMHVALLELIQEMLRLEADLASVRKKYEEMEAALDEVDQCRSALVEARDESG